MVNLPTLKSISSPSHEERKRMSQYTQDMKSILAALQEPGTKGDDTQPLPNEEDEILHAYPVNIGNVQGILYTKEEVASEFIQASTVIDSQDPQEESAPPTTQPATPQKEPPYFLHFILLLLFFILLDNLDSAFANLSPTATITIIPKAQTIAASATFPIAELQGRVLPALTLSQSLTVKATGKGHQDARSATGGLTFYNGLSTSQNVAIGTVLTGGDGIAITTDETATIPPANPPSLGETSITAHAIQPGSSGNIQAGEINTTLSTGLFVKNTSDFSGGRNARDFTYVKSTDIQQATSAISPQLSQSIQAALTSQLQPGEALVSPTCATTESADHQPEDEALTVKVTVSQTCGSAVAYNKDALQTQATALLTHQARKLLGAGYRLFGSVQVTVMQTAHTPYPLVLSLSSQGVWVYQINETSMKNLVAGKPRSEAIQLLLGLPGIQRISIAGISDNAPLPDDTTHIHLLIIVGVS